MERINGSLVYKYDYTYDDIGNYFKRLDRYKLCFYFDDKFFKEEDNVYEELLGSKIANFLGIKCVNYDMAKVILKDRSVNGVISDNFIMEGYRTVNFKEILDDYFSCHEDYFFDDIYNDMNLELIWNALEDRYKNYENGSKIVANIMNDMVSYFLLDILIGNIDNGKYNYEILESDVDARCCPYFDFEYIFMFSGTNFTVECEDNNNVLNVIMKFLRISDRLFIDRFIDMHNMLTPSKLEELFIEVENDIECELPRNFKNISYLAYSRFYYMLDEVLDVYRDMNCIKK